MYVHYVGLMSELKSKCGANGGIEMGCIAEREEALHVPSSLFSLKGVHTHHPLSL